MSKMASLRSAPFDFKQRDEWPRWKREARYNALEYSITRDHTMIGYDWLHVYACMMLLSLTTLFIKYSYVIMHELCMLYRKRRKFGGTKVWRIVIFRRTLFANI